MINDIIQDRTVISAATKQVSFDCAWSAWQKFVKAPLINTVYLDHSREGVYSVVCVQSQEPRLNSYREGLSELVSWIGPNFTAKIIQSELVCAVITPLGYIIQC